jgi:hypothetical protein
MKGRAMERSQAGRTQRHTYTCGWEQQPRGLAELPQTVSAGSVKPAYLS